MSFDRLQSCHVLIHKVIFAKVRYEKLLLTLRISFSSCFECDCWGWLILWLLIWVAIVFVNLFTLFRGRLWRLLINPFNFPWFLNKIFVIFVGGHYRAHLRIHESISQQKFLTCKGRLRVWKLFPFARYLSVQSSLESRLICRELIDECGSDLKIWSSTVQKFKTLQERPFVLAHDVSSKSARRSTLTSDRVNKYRFCCLQGLFNEFKYCIRCFIFGIQE